MLFSSYQFLLIFLPLCWVLFRLSLRFGRIDLVIRILTACSLGFYAYWNPWHVPIIVGSILCNYGISLRIIAGTTNTRSWLWLGIVANLMLIVFFKYSGFLISNVNILTGGSLEVLTFVLPLGISFFTFQQIAYLVDTVRGDPPARSLWEYSLFVLFFPHLIAGPIVHPKVLLPQFRQPENFRRFEPWMPQGIALFSIGLFKKVVIADSLAPDADRVFEIAANNPVLLSAFDAWAGVLSYSLQIYFDFSGYSDMAIGLGLMFGILLPQNFNSPYQSTSIVDFWRRWHMTLSAFLRDYLYIAMGGNRHGGARRYLNLILTMLIGGLWHGANWTFVVWGGIHGACLAINHAWSRVSARLPSAFTPPQAVSRAWGWAATMFVVCMAWVMFRSETVDSALSVYRALFAIDGLSLPRSASGVLGDAASGGFLRFDGLSPSRLFLDPPGTLALIVALIAAVVWLPNASGALARSESNAEGATQLCVVPWVSTTSGAIATAVIFAIGFFSLGRVQAFLYFQF